MGDSFMDNYHKRKQINEEVEEEFDEDEEDY